MKDEIFKLKSGEYYTIWNHDIEYMSQELKNLLEEYVREDTVVALCLSLDELKLSTLLLYQGCRRCGATMIRCGFSDIERQMFLLDKQQVDIVIASKRAYKYIQNKLTRCQWILLDDFENIMCTTEVDGCILCRIYEFYDIPAVAYLDKNKNIYVPGYEVLKRENETILQSKNMMKSFQIKDYKICNNSTRICENKARSVVQSLIEIQIKKVIEQLGDCDIDEEGRIEFTSLGSLEMIVMLEEAFGIEIPIENIDMNQFRNIHKMAQIIDHVLEGILDD